MKKSHTIHVGIALSYLEQMPNHKLAGCLSNSETGEKLDAETIRDILAKYRLDGVRVISGCETPNPDGSCPGHPVTESPRN